MLRVNEERVQGKTGLPQQKRQDNGTLHDMFYSSDYLQNLGEETQ